MAIPHRSRLGLRPLAARLLVACLIATVLIGVLPQYLRALRPAVAVVATLISTANHWQLEQVAVIKGLRPLDANLEVTTTIQSGQQTGRVVARKQGAGACRSAVVLLLLLVLWPAASSSERRLRLALGLPALYLATAVEQGAALLGSTAVAAEELAGHMNPAPPLERWANFTEAGGSLVLAATLALALIAAASRLTSRRRIG